MTSSGRASSQSLSHSLTTRLETEVFAQPGKVRGKHCKHPAVVPHKPTFCPLNRSKIGDWMLPKNHGDPPSVGALHVGPSVKTHGSRIVEFHSNPATRCLGADPRPLGAFEAPASIRRAGGPGLGGCARWALFLVEKLIDCHLDVFGNLANKRWSDLSSSAVRNSGLPSVGMLELAVRASLSNQQKAMAFNQHRDHLA